MLNQFINAGVLIHLSHSEIKRIKLLNQMVLVFFGALSVKLITEIIVADYTGTMICLWMASMFFCVWLFNYYGCYQLAQIGFLTTQVLIFVSLNIFFGRGIAPEFLLFSYTVVILLFYDDLSLRFMWVGIFALAYIGVLFFLRYNEPVLLKDLMSSSFYYMLLSNVSIIFILFSSFIRENKKFQKETTQLVEELKRKNIELRSVNDELENINEDLENFATVASHDLKTPLKNIKGLLQIIENSIEQGKTEKISDYLEYAQVSAKSMDNLIEDILEFSCIGNKEKAFAPVCLKSIAQRTQNNLHNIIEEKGAIIDYSELPSILGNEGQLVSLFQNLIENGIKYNEADTPHIEIKGIEHSNEYELLVKDNGIGIKKDCQEKVFNMFYRLHTELNYEGTGIGLATCRKIVTHHGGTLSILSSSDTGTVFKIIFTKHSQQIISGKEAYNKRNLEYPDGIQNIAAIGN